MLGNLPDFIVSLVTAFTQRETAKPTYPSCVPPSNIDPYTHGLLNPVRSYQAVEDTPVHDKIKKGTYYSRSVLNFRNAHEDTHVVLGPTIGRGCFGKVKLGWVIETASWVAIKIIGYKDYHYNDSQLLKKKIEELQEYILSRTKREVSTLEKLNLLLLPQLFRTKINPGPHDKTKIISCKYYLCMNYFDAKTLNHYFQLHFCTKLAIAATIINDLIEIHAKDIIHRDLKPNNILVFKLPDGSWVSKIIDFGLSIPLHGYINPQDVFFRLSYRTFTAPEIKAALTRPISEIMHIPYSINSDIYSLGKTFTYLFGNDASPEVKQLITDMMHENPNQRPKLEACLKRFLELKALEMKNLKTKAWENIYNNSAQYCRTTCSLQGLKALINLNFYTLDTIAQELGSDLIDSELDSISDLKKYSKILLYTQIIYPFIEKIISIVAEEFFKLHAILSEAVPSPILFSILANLNTLLVLCDLASLSIKYTRKIYNQDQDLAKTAKEDLKQILDSLMCSLLQHLLYASITAVFINPIIVTFVVSLAYACTMSLIKNAPSLYQQLTQLDLNNLQAKQLLGSIYEQRYTMLKKCAIAGSFIATAVLVKPNAPNTFLPGFEQRATAAAKPSAPPVPPEPQNMPKLTARQ